MSVENMPFIERDRGKDLRHGTLSGALSHSQAGEPPCDACRAAKSAYDKRRLEATDLQLRNRLHAKAQQKALRDLRQAHPDEYRELYLKHKASVFAPEET